MIDFVRERREEGGGKKGGRRDETRSGPLARSAEFKVKGIC